MNAAAAAAHNATYLRTHDAFFEALLLNWMQAAGALTVDGEHHNEHGAAIVKRPFTDTLLSFYHHAWERGYLSYAVRLVVRVYGTQTLKSGILWHAHLGNEHEIEQIKMKLSGRTAHSPHSTHTTET